MSRESFFDVFVDQLKDIYSAENQILEAFPTLISAAFSQTLKDGFKRHKTETQNQLRRLKTIFQKLNISPGNVVCNGMKGLIQEAQQIIHHNPSSLVEDTALIGIAQKIEHYEIAAYGTLRAFARHLDLDEVADILDETLDEEGHTDQYLTKLAEGSLFSSGINEKAMEDIAQGRPKGLTTVHTTPKKKRTAHLPTKKVSPKSGIALSASKTTTTTKPAAKPAVASSRPTVTKRVAAKQVAAPASRSKSAKKTTVRVSAKLSKSKRTPAR